MNQAYFHILVTHFPVMGTSIGVLVLAVGILTKLIDVRKTGLWIIAICAALAIPSMLSGEGAEEIAENFAEVSHKVIHHHEAHAERFIWVSCALSLLAFCSLWVISRRKDYQEKILWITLLAGIAVCLMALRVAHTGGQIRHPETALDFAVPSPKDH